MGNFFLPFSPHSDAVQARAALKAARDDAARAEAEARARLQEVTAERDRLAAQVEKMTAAAAVQEAKVSGTSLSSSAHPGIHDPAWSQ